MTLRSMVGEHECDEDSSGDETDMCTGCGEHADFCSQCGMSNCCGYPTPLFD